MSGSCQLTRNATDGVRSCWSGVMFEIGKTFACFGRRGINFDENLEILLATVPNQHSPDSIPHPVMPSQSDFCSNHRISGFWRCRKSHHHVTWHWALLLPFLPTPKFFVASYVATLFISIIYAIACRIPGAAVLCHPPYNQRMELTSCGLAYFR